MKKILTLASILILLAIVFYTGAFDNTACRIARTIVVWFSSALV